MDNRRLQSAYQLGGPSPGTFGLDCAAGEITIDRTKMTATGVFATSSRDRVGDVLDIAGIDTSNHRLLPIVLWDHGKNPNLAFPIGRTTSDDGEYLVRLDPENGIAIATTRFSQSLPEAEQIFALIDERIIGGQSIGYREIKTRPLVEQGRKAGKFLDEIELVEDSWCCAPVNAEAVGGHAEMVRKALSRDQVCGKSLSPAIRRSLEPLAERPSIWSPGWTPDPVVPWVPNRKPLTPALSHGETKSLSAVEAPAPKSLETAPETPNSASIAGEVPGAEETKSLSDVETKAFAESKHPRATNGEFGPGGGGTAVAERPKAAKRAEAIAKPDAPGAGVKKDFAPLKATYDKLADISPEHAEIGQMFLASLKSAGMSKADAVAHAANIKAVLTQFSPEEAKRFVAHSSGVDVKGTPKALNDAIAAGSEKVKKLNAEGRTIGGVVQWKDGKGKLSIDGDSVSKHAQQLIGHESMHVIDGPKHEVSESKVFKAIYEKHGKGGQYGAYAGSSSAEFLARIGEMLYTGTGIDALDKQMPGLKAALSPFGISGRGTKQYAQAPEVFDGGVDEGGMHADIISKSALRMPDTSTRHGAFTALIAAAKKAPAAAGKIEEMVGEKVKTNVAKLPGPLQTLVKGAWTFCTYSYDKCQAAVAVVAKERGLSEDQVKRASAVCCCVNLMCAKAVPLGMEHNGAGGPLGLAAFGAGFIPVGSIGYLAFSTAVNPLASYRAAAKGVKSVLAKTSRGKSADVSPEMQALAASIVDRADTLGDGFDDWTAAFMAALDETQGDVQRSIDAADQWTASGDGSEPADGETRTKSLSVLLSLRIGGKSAEFDESKHPRDSGGKFGHGTVSTNSAGMRVRRDEAGAPIKAHDTPEGTKHTEEEHFDTEKRPGFLRNTSEKVGRVGEMSQLQIPKEEKEKYDLETANGLVFRYAGSEGNEEKVAAQYLAYHEHLTEQLKQHVDDTLEDIRAGNVDSDYVRAKIGEICNEFVGHVQSSKEELANWARTHIENEHRGKTDAKVDQINAGVDKAFSRPDEYRGMLDAAEHVRSTFEDIASDLEPVDGETPDPDEVVDAYEDTLAGMDETIELAASHTHEDLADVKTEVSDELEQEHDDERQQFEDEAGDMVGDLDEMDPHEAAEQATEFNRRADDANHPAVHIYHDDEQGWHVIDDDQEEFEPDDVGVEPKTEKSLTLAGA